MTPASGPSSAARLWSDAGSGSAAALDRFPIVVHSHAPWSPAFARPYQTHSRLAERHPVLFIERPVFSGEAPTDEIRVRHPLPHLAVAQPVLAGDPVPPDRAEARVRDALRHGGLAREAPPAVHWVYRPDLAARIDLFAAALAVIDDCVDEDPACAEASGDALRGRADLVFAGGHAQLLSKLETHPRARLVDIGVDFEHFRAGAGAPLPRDLERIPPPRVGFAGVLDERVDLELLSRIAAERPQVSIVLLGPSDGMPRERLPHGPNVFAIGPRPYEERPAYLGGFAAGLLPYRTDGIHALFHPPELLELLAVGRPVVSTPLPEVARRWADVVAIAEPDRFGTALDEALTPGPRPATARGVERARSASWPRIVGEMEILVARAVQDRLRAAAAPGPPETLPAS